MGSNNGMFSLPFAPAVPKRHRPTTRFVSFLDAVRDHRWHFVCIWAAMVLLALIAWLVVPTRYTATAAVLIQTKVTDPIAGIALPGGVLSNHLTTQAEVMKSERVALGALRTVLPQEDSMWRKRWQEATGGRGVYENWVAEQLLKGVTVGNARESNILVLAYKDSDPERAARVANGFVQAYMETAVDLRLQPARQYSAFFDERVRRAKEALEAAQARLVEFQQRNGINSLDEKADVEDRRLAELATQITVLEQKIAETRGREGEAATGAAPQEALRDPVVADARIQLAKQEARMAELQERLGNGHPQLAEQRRALDQHRAVLAGALARATQSLRSGGKAETAQLGLLRAAYKEQEVKVLGRKALRDEGLRMQRNVDNLQRNYDLVFSRFQQTTLESEDVQPNVSVLKVATPLPHPSTPPLPLFLAAGALLGLLLAAATVFALDRYDGRLRYAEHIVDALQKPFLVQLPTRGTALAKPSGSPALSNANPPYASHEKR